MEEGEQDFADEYGEEEIDENENADEGEDKFDRADYEKWKKDQDNETKK